MATVATLRDVAREAGVHVSTASRALNPETRSIVNIKTAKRVLAVADRLGYRPHPLARGLRTNRTLSVGMIVPDLMNPLFPPIYAGAEASLREMGYSLLITGDDDDPVKAKTVMASLLERRVDGLILATAHLDFASPAIRQAKVPTVLVNRACESMTLPSVVGDDHAGIGIAVRHLVEQGHTSIAHVSGPQDVSTGLTRRQAFVAWINSEGLTAQPELIVESEAFRTDAGYAACERLLDSNPKMTAIVAGNDLIALGCYDALAKRGINVPNDVSVTGYNDITFIDRVYPPLTTVAIPFQEMGAAAGRILLSLMALEDWRNGANYTSTRLRPSLVVRASTAPPSVS